MRTENLFSICRCTDAVLEDLRLKAYQLLTDACVWYFVSLYSSFICSAQDGPQVLRMLCKNWSAWKVWDRFPAEPLALCTLSSLAASGGFCLQWNILESFYFYFFFMSKPWKSTSLWKRLSDILCKLRDKVNIPSLWGRKRLTCWFAFGCVSRTGSPNSSWLQSGFSVLLPLF